MLVRAMARNGLKNITIHQMEALIHLIEERSFSRAARKMFLSQPSLTKHIQNMEELLGIPLVNRESRSISLTPEGKILFDYARRFVKLREEAGEKILGAREMESGEITISASTIPATYILPWVLSGFRSLYPDIRLHVRTLDSEETIEAILNNRGDIGFIGKKPAGGRLEAEPLWKDRLVLAVPKDHRWQTAGRVKIQELLREPFIIRERGSGTREILERYFKEKKNISLSQFRIVAELGSSEAVKEAVVAGLGVSFLSVYAVGRELKTGDLTEIPLPGCRIERYFYLINRRQFGLMHHHRLFIDFVKRYQLPSPLL
jgi:DNA-binding transcriptional LysR family regulator